MKKFLSIIIHVIVFPFWIVIDPICLMYTWRTWNYWSALRFDLNCLCHTLTGNVNYSPF
jgi:hypothetical protein